MRIKNVNEWGDRQENEKSSFSRDCQRNVVWFLISQQELVLERGANRNRNRSFTVGKICIIEFENRSDIWIKMYLRVKLSRIASLMRGERSFDFHYFSHNSREFYSIDASETYDFRIFPFSPIFRSCFTLERIFEKFPDIVSLSLDEFSREIYSFRSIWNIWYSGYSVLPIFYFQTNLHPFDVSETRNFQIFLFSHFLNTRMFYSRQTNPHTIRCDWNVRHSFVPILKACWWIFSSIPESFTLKRIFSMHLKHTTSGYSFLSEHDDEFYSFQTNLYPFIYIWNVRLPNIILFPILWRIFIFPALSRILVSNESFRCRSSSKYRPAVSSPFTFRSRAYFSWPRPIKRIFQSTFH